MRFKLPVITLLILIMISTHAHSQWNAGVLHSFNGSDGAISKGSLTLFGTTIYGRTSSGGANGEGVIFKIETDSSGFQVLYDFQTGSSNMLGKEPHHDAMLYYDDNLYGTALEGGDDDNGVIYRISLTGKDYTALHVFQGGNNDGAQPHSGVILVEDVFYGITAAGGTHGNGTIYRMDPDGTDFSVLHSFHKSTGDDSHGRLTLGSDGHTLFGMTKTGGSQDLGVIFSFDLSDSNYTVLHAFTGSASDGSSTDHGFLTLSNDTLFGMTQFGGASNNGVIFSLNEDGTNFQILHSFGSSTNDGTNPYGSLQLSNGFLYGTTRKGGVNDEGTVFRINTSGTVYEIIHSLDVEVTGEYPIDNVVLSENGKEVYCLSQAGGMFDPTGNNQYGTIFELNTFGSVGIAGNENVTPEDFTLHQNYPNPFNPVTTINYNLKTAGQVSLIIYDISGKEVALIVNEWQSPGFYSVKFNADNISGGVYFYELQSGNVSQTKKLVVIK